MDFPRIHPKKTGEEQSSGELPDQTTESSTSAGIASEADSVQSTAEEPKEETYFRADWVYGREDEFHRAPATIAIPFVGIGYDQETTSITFGEVAREEVRAGGAVQLGYKVSNANVGGQNVDIDLNAILYAILDIKTGFAAEFSIGQNMVFQLGADMFAGLLLGLEGVAQLGDIGDVHGGLFGGFGVGFVIDTNTTFDGEVLNYDFKLGVGVGLAGEVDFGFSVKPYDAVQLIGNLLAPGRDAVEDWFTDIGGVPGLVDGAADLIGGVLTGEYDAPEGAVDSISNAYNW